MKGKEWIISIAFTILGVVFSAGMFKSKGENTAIQIDKVELRVSEHETRISKVEQKVDDIRDGVKELLRRTHR